MHIHILGICGTFMGGVALLARAEGHRVSGSDANVYPPMSTQLQDAGIELMEGYAPGHLQPAPDMVVIGNAMSRGNPAVEYVLDQGLRYISGPQWLADYILPDRWVLAVAGTHGKTSTAGLLAWILEDAGLSPGFLIGGIPQNFGFSARIGESPFFVVEADEYDTAFFDKRSKFVHYRPRTVIMNNLEFDHADIFDNLAMIQRQFHHLVRTIPSTGLIVAPERDVNVADVLQMGCWTPVEYFSGSEGSHWGARDAAADGSEFDVFSQSEKMGHVSWGLTGLHSINNGLAAIAAARHAGVPPVVAIEALSRFRSIKRRMEVRGEVGGVTVYDDFAHHPTAIATTLEGLRARVGSARIIAVLEPRSNTMRMGVHKDSLAGSLQDADRICIYRPADIEWDIEELFSGSERGAEVFHDVGAIVTSIAERARVDDHVLVMSNGGFENIHQRILTALEHSQSVN